MAIVQLNLAAQGLTGEVDPARLRSGDLITAQNVVFTTPGVLEKEGGSTKQNVAAIDGGAPILAGTEFWATEIAQRRLIATPTRLIKDDMTNLFATVLKAGLTNGASPYFCQGGEEDTGKPRLMFCLNGFDQVQVQVADAATTVDLATPPADWTGAGNAPRFMFPHSTFLIGGGNANRPHFLYGCLPTDHTNWTDVATLGLQVYPGVGRRLQAAINAFGKSWVFKWPRGIFWINEVGSAVSGWNVLPATTDRIGIAPSPWAIVHIDDGPVAFVNQSGGVMLMEETNATLSGVRFIDLTSRNNLNLLAYIQAYVNLQRLTRCQVTYYKDKKQVHVTYSGVGTQVADQRLVLDFSDQKVHAELMTGYYVPPAGQGVRAEITTKDVQESIWQEMDATNILRPAIGDNVGFVRRIDRLNYDVDGAAYPFTVQTAPTDFSDVDASYAQKKLFYRLHLEYVPTGNITIPCDVIVDGRTIGTVTWPLSATGAVFPFSLPAVLGGNPLSRRTQDIGGEGYLLSLRFYDTSLHNPRLARVFVEFEPIGMQP